MHCDYLLAKKMDQAVHPQHKQMYLDCQSKKVIQLKEQVLFNTKMYNVGFLHSPSDQLPIPGKGSPSGTTSPSHDAVPGLTIPKRILSHDMPCETFN
ncbi:hypothetical protein T4C_11852 [Trichinella pseudospiralis]|uniref:Uncharacterized protein n=1 Tax=Trichinella pseudospiralis TaxID=6337 RepID=A0A0V1GE40_TRIPS|nr:hypothetical protein T4C_11852 [Trichinella pseudospiralis]